MNIPEAVDIVTPIHDFLKEDPVLADIKDWNKANGFISTKPTGISLGIAKERYDSSSRDGDYCTAHMNLFCWIRNKDQAAGEADLRNLAHYIRKSLSGDNERSLNGNIVGCFVSDIDYITADATQGLLLHIAEMKIEVDYYEERNTY